MKRRACAAATVLFACVAAAAGAARQPFCTVDFSQGSDLKLLFDSGLRPTRVHGMEGMLCEVVNTPLEFIVPPDHHVTIRAHYAHFDIDADDRISQLIAVSANFDLHTAERIARQLVSSLGLPVPDLTATFQKAAESRSFEVLRDVRFVLHGEPEAYVMFYPGDFVREDPQRIHVRVVLAVYWKDRPARQGAARSY